ncbi:MAG TPA: BatA and WFA domain-containing protein [Verrucomicrobiales bacterium]|nr:BatA and WFA domain-containing protein [Verrucomicrobiales bacterium]
MFSGFSFANPLGFWALLGIPAILLIHFLQRQSRVVTVSTLFLLQQLRRESVSGRRFEHLRSSVPLWLQLLMVLLLTWILAQPQWERPEAVHRVVVVLDGSASMSAFRPALRESLNRELSRLGKLFRREEYVVLDSRRFGEPVFNGTEIPPLLEALEQWRPYGAGHDFTPALRVARSLAGEEGSVILVTDHIQEVLPYNAALIAVGEKTANVGFAGVRFVDESTLIRAGEPGAATAPAEPGKQVWLALIRNHADIPQTRQWFLSTGQSRTQAAEITLAPGEMRTLRGTFPEGADHAALHLTPDTFSLDDVLPLVLPSPKKLTVTVTAPEDLAPLLREVSATLDHTGVPEPGQNADLSLVSYDPLDPREPAATALVYLHQGVSAPGAFLTGAVAAENHPLVEGLNWQGFIGRDSPEIPRIASDTVLLWQGSRALVFLRTSEGRHQLIFNFDFTRSNAERQPGFVVLAHRFAESLRREKIAPETLNFETLQPVPLACQTSAGAPPLRVESVSAIPGEATTTTREEIPLLQVPLLRAPDAPGYFTVRQGETTLLTAAAHFADSRESDLGGAASISTVNPAAAKTRAQTAVEDSRWQLWLLITLAALLLAWWFVERPRPNPGDVQPVTT